MANLKLQFQKEQLDKLFGPVIKNSALLQLVDPIITKKENDKIGVAANWSDALVHVNGGGRKVFSDEQLATFDVNMSNFYKMILIDDYQSSDEKATVDQVIEQLKKVVAATLDKSIFPGLVANSALELTGVATSPVDETAASWLAVINEIAVSGYTANGMILDNTLKPLLQTALVEGTVTSPLYISMPDGFEVAGTRVYFRAGLGGRGLIADFDQIAVAFKDGAVTGEIHLAQNEMYMRELNSDGVYTGWRVGAGISNVAAARFVSFAATDEA